MGPLERFTQSMLPAIEAELHRVVKWNLGEELDEMLSILAYHLGWEGEGTSLAAGGKRIRPLLVLLATAATGGEWQRALPAAAGVELVHNFSLIHDDIQDQSPLRRGRPTIWMRWGVAQAINIGDAMFSLAQLALIRLQETVSEDIALQATRILQETCLALTQGQFLDMAYESRTDLSLDSYWSMVSGKTAALLGACTELGALVSLSEKPVCETYRLFGRFLGLAFQAQDDLLGIWGQSSVTGKSAESDLLSGKKSLPVIYGLEQKGTFAARWLQGGIKAREVSPLAAQLEAEGARAFTEEQANRLTDQALAALEEANPQGEAGESLFILAKQLLRREM